MEISDHKTIFRLQIDMPSSIDPVFASDTICREIIDNVYEKLFNFIGNNCVPVLVEKWWVESEKIYYFVLKKNIYFHDGLECDSFAVKESLVRMLNQSNKARALFRDLLKHNKIICIDKYLLRIELEYSYLDLIYLLAIQESSIINPQLLKKSDLLIKNASGTGPFIIMSIDNYKKEIILKRFEKYWGNKPDVNYIKIISESDYEKRKQLFLKIGDIMAVQASKIKEFKIDKNIRIDLFDALDMVLFLFNTKRKPLSINEFRLALLMSFDYTTFLKYGRMGMGTRINTAIPKGVYSHNSKIPYINYNIYKAKQIISDIYLPNSTNLKILSVLGMEDADIACNNLKRGLDILGIQSEIHRLPFTQFCIEFDLGNFDISFLSYAPDTNNPYSFAYDFYHKNGDIASVIGFSNNKINSLIDQVRFEKDSIKKYNIYAEIQSIAATENVYMWLYQGQNLKVYKKHLINVSHNILDGDYYFKDIIKLEGTNYDQ